MKLSEIEKLYTTLKQLNEREMPIKISYKFSKIFSQISTDFEFYSKKIQGILSKYGEKDEKGNFVIKDGMVPFQKDYADLAMKELDELNSIDITLPDYQFSLEELEPLSLTPAQVSSLTNFIKE